MCVERRTFFVAHFIRFTSRPVEINLVGGAVFELVVILYMTGTRAARRAQLNFSVRVAGLQVRKPPSSPFFVRLWGCAMHPCRHAHLSNWSQLQKNKRCIRKTLRRRRGPAEAVRESFKALPPVRHYRYCCVVVAICISCDWSHVGAYALPGRGVYAAHTFFLPVSLLTSHIPS